MLADDITERDITGRGTTSGTAEETLPLTLGLAAPAASLAVPQGSTWMISDWIICAPPAGSIFKIQQSNDNGVSWFNKAIGRVQGGKASKVFTFRTPIKVKGSATTLVRQRVQTPPAPGAVDVTWGTMSQP
jgi:hypothetical protein